MGLILVVSEDVVEIEKIKAALSVHGWWVTVAADREAALQVAADQAPKLVMVDHSLSGAIDLVRSFGTVNGGPGVLACVPEDFEDSLALKEAGVDELLTQPVSPMSVLEAVQRCLATPREGPVERPAPSTQLLTTEEIFGDVLRELEDADEVAPAPTAVPAATPAPAPEAAPAVFESAPEPVPAPAPAPLPAPVVSLAGLFDGETQEDAQTVAGGSLAAAMPDSLADTGQDAADQPAEPPPAADSLWGGEERRSADRPWAADGVSVPGVDALFEPPESAEEAAPFEPQAAESEPAELEDGDVETVETAAVEFPPIVSALLDEPAEDEVVAEAPDEPVEERRIPRAALAIGSIAAALLVAAGIVFMRGSEPVEPPASALVEEPVAAEVEPLPPAEAAALVVEEEPQVVEVGTPAPQPEPPVVAPRAIASSPSASSSEDVEDLDLRAIVDEELERREEELRRVFLEEEKRLLRELKNLDESEPPPDAGGEGAGGDDGGVRP